MNVSDFETVHILIQQRSDLIAALRSVIGHREDHLADPLSTYSATSDTSFVTYGGVNIRIGNRELYNLLRRDIEQLDCELVAYGLDVPVIPDFPEPMDLR